MTFRFLANNLAIMLAMGLFYGLLIRNRPRQLIQWQILCGFFFGLAAIVTMTNSFVLRPGAIFDCRSVILSVTGMFAGPVPALIAAVLAALYRIWQGGVGAATGVSVIFSTTAVGLVFYYLRRKYAYLNKLLWLYVFGILVHIVMLLLMLTFPRSIAIEVYKTITLPVLTLYPIGTILLSKIFIDQENRLNAEEQLRAANRQLKEGEAKLKNLLHLFESSLNEIYIFEADTLHFIQANAGARRNIGYTLAELQQLTPLDLKPELTAQTFAEITEPLRCGLKQIVVFETNHQRKDGSTYPVEVHLQMSVLDGRQVFVAFILDITERKKAERQQKRLMRALEAKNRELQDIVYAASHDLKTPLINIAGFANLLSQYCARLRELGQSGNPAVRSLFETDIPEALHFITQGAQKMKSLIDGLLQVARLGTYTPQLSRLDMNNLISSIITTAAFRIQQTGAKVTADNLPPCVGDAGQINRVFTNLLDNALKYANPARPPRIHISGRHHDNQCVYCVEDNGIGICPEHQDKVFELFHRLNPKGIIEGEGLGLTIVRRILNMHNGKVWVESVPGQGSKFFVALPDKEEV
ncbi:MAG: PAS domain S-box protein [Phycisphaerae bacterium]|nr:PAS domain S-box protein [Phycisphaerae bacterium]